MQYYSINGKLVDRNNARLQVDDLVISRGFGIFDFLRLIDGQLLFIDDHIDRLYRSAGFMGMDLDFSKSDLKKYVEGLVKANGKERAAIKMILTGGYSQDGYTPAKPNLIILQLELKGPTPEQYKNGIKLMLCKHVRELPHIKTINYAVPILLLPKLKEQGFTDVLYHDGTQVSESSRSNFFIVDKDNNIITPTEEILYGITRKNVIEMAKSHYRILEQDVSLEDIRNASEAFITSSTKGVLPIVACGDMIIGDGTPGEVTRNLIKSWSAMLEKRYGIENMV